MMQKFGKFAILIFNRLLQPEPRQLKGGSSWQRFQSSGALGILLLQVIRGLGFSF